jgi:hypothetical protein
MRVKHQTDIKPVRNTPILMMRKPHASLYTFGQRNRHAFYAAPDAIAQINASKDKF